LAAIRSAIRSGANSSVSDEATASTQARVPALLIPIWNVHGEIATYQTRADEPQSQVLVTNDVIYDFKMQIAGLRLGRLRVVDFIAETRLAGFLEA